MPTSTDDVVANLAVVFHWSVHDCADFDIDELMAWNERARIRSQVTE
ncbi:GpE family phage tail protein [Acinetobacter venetianus]|nr:GpE family phage tail protein [Acinetobacter venetianus]MCR4529805.1 GpE family phage tail protein [Acinetobacter venetianus]